MNTYKTRITLGSLTIMACAYFLLPTETTKIDDAEIKQVSTHQAPTPLTTHDQVKHQGNEANIESKIKRLSQKEIEVDYVFSSTQDYEASSRFGSLPSYMADTTLERFSYDANGKLIVNEKIKHIIEFFLMATQEEGREQTIARLQEYITMTLPVDAANEAQLIVDNYLSYKDSLYNGEEFSLIENMNENATIDGLKSDLEKRKVARRHYLGTTDSDALFGNEEQYDDFMMARIEINSDTSLNESEKDQHIAQAENSLPPELAKRMRYKRVEKNITKQIKSLRTEDGNEQQIYTLREEFYGKKVADRMAYLEENSDDWKNKVEQFNQEKDQILSQGSLSLAEKKSLISQTRQNFFTPKERIKLAVQSIRG